MTLNPKTDRSTVSQRLYRICPMEFKILLWRTFKLHCQPKVDSTWKPQRGFQGNHQKIYNFLMISPKKSSEDFFGRTLIFEKNSLKSLRDPWCFPQLKKSSAQTAKTTQKTRENLGKSWFQPTSSREGQNRAKKGQNFQENLGKMLFQPETPKGGSKLC